MGSALGVNFWKIQRGGGVIGKIPSVGGYGYFLELHILVTLYAVYYFQMLRHGQTSGISCHAHECLCINQTINYVLSNN